LPLNISREMLQGSKVVDGIRSGSVKKILGSLANLAENDKEKYQAFWSEFGAALKEGPGEDFSNREEIAALLRFSSTLGDSQVQDVSLGDYVGRMKEGQEKIYYITADSFAAAKNSPHLEIFRKRGIEVLLMGERVDEWLMAHLTEYDGKTLQSVAKGSLDLKEVGSEEEPEKKDEVEQAFSGLVTRVKEALGERVKEVRVSHRLTDSPACLVVDEQAMSQHLERILKQAGQEVPSTEPILEINPEHPLIRRLDGEEDGETFNDWSAVLLDQAVLAEGGQLEDPATFVKRLNALLLAE